MVDLPGYGYAKIAKTEREKFARMIESYLKERTNLANLFVLVDSRHSPQKLDLEFFRNVAQKGIPLSIVFTKTDKLKPGQLEQNIDLYKQTLLEEWEDLPPLFFTSATTRQGRDELLKFIDKINTGQI